jgi:hypothetical protein
VNEGTRPLGFQNIEARLWEDQFAAWEKLSQTQRTQWCVASLGTLLDAATAGLIQTNRYSDGTNVLALAVMVSGQPYAEDKESRIRTRYAVGAALGSGGYKPETADHIGLVARPWPSSKELDQWKTNANAVLGIASAGASDSKFCQISNTSLLLRAPFEQYTRREFFPRAEYSITNVARKASYDRVLLIWLDEEYFDDAPALRLAFFRNEVMGVTKTSESSSISQTYSNISWAIIGPRSSSTMRQLIRGASEITTNNPNLWNQVATSLENVPLILATPPAMDEVLLKPVEGVGPSVAAYNKPREAMAQAIGQGKLFKSVANFACADKQFADHVLHELQLRGINPLVHSNQHLVLISEWDNFFSRMAGLAFAAEMSVRQKRPAASNALDFIAQAREGTNLWPATLHRFVYLQGLDGEAAPSEGARDSEKKSPGARAPTTLEALAEWTPDANKAEGPAQFDYLARLGDALVGLDRQLWREGGRVAAVGIIGSDVYDTLLILQALRNRLPDAVFFANDLDARLWHPRELRWSRNLVVISGHGLRLRESLQAGVAPFRESSQCAYFLATLHAIDRYRTTESPQVWPRRFEIGRHGPVDMSTNAINLEEDDASWPHPVVRRASAFPWVRMPAAFGVLAVAGLLVWKPLRRLVWPSRAYCCEPLRLSDEDVGGTDGAEAILQRLASADSKDNELGELLAKVISRIPPLPHLSADALRELVYGFIKMKDEKDEESRGIMSKLSYETRVELALYDPRNPPEPSQCLWPRNFISLERLRENIERSNGLEP